MDKSWPSMSFASMIDNKEQGIPTDFMMSIQSQSHKNGNRGSELQKDENGGSESQEDGNGRCKISNGTSSTDAKLVESSGSTTDDCCLMLLRRKSERA
ncbi:hypothetical protein RchiOBHm_Chr5g0069471 [Rosa chinensis]|uniref:Uncharacterized protein n=1 Tax=Rosa chinensis TaxID=74649 RepID=A0A2P6QJZ6_ROSCH|nr:hypothetical protein RchiOBHm_Chr5g0069471 [Rosa chinensis]